MSDQNKSDITLQVFSIKTKKFSVCNDDDIRSRDRLSFNFNISYSTFIDKDRKIVGFYVNTNIFTEKELINKVSELSTRIEYLIANFNEVVKELNGLLVLPDNLLLMLMSISLSTTRGILAAKLEGSSLDGVNLPVIDPKAFKPVPLPTSS